MYTITLYVHVPEMMTTAATSKITARIQPTVMSTTTVASADKVNKQRNSSLTIPTTMNTAENENTEQALNNKDLAKTCLKAYFGSCSLT